MKIILASFPALLLLTACQSTGGSGGLKHQAEGGYQPDGEAIHMLRPRAEVLQKFGIDGVCPGWPNIDCVARGLDHDKYAGMKFYFLEDELQLMTQGYQTSYAAPIVLENGELATFTISRFSKDHEGRKRDTFLSPYEIELFQSFEPEPIVEGADVIIEEYDISSTAFPYKLSNGRRATQERIETIRAIAPNNPEAASILTNYRIEVDQIDGVIKIFNPRGRLDSHFRPEITIRNGHADLRYRAYYSGDDWLFVDSVTLSTANARWDSPAREFLRDHTGGTVWEYRTFEATPELQNAVQSATDVGQATLRFRGRQYYRDHELTREDMTTISDLSKVEELLDLK